MSEFARKASAETLWPAETDCDRLDWVFQALNANGIIALHHAGYTMSEGLGDVSEVLHHQGHNHIRGYCFYHGQDLERVIVRGRLALAFGILDNVSNAKIEIGHVIKQVLEVHDFRVEWNGDSETRLSIPNFDWKRRKS